MKKGIVFKNSIEVLLLGLLLLCSFSRLFAQNSLTGDGFGGRLWYVAHNYQVGAYSAYTICGSNNQLYGWGSNYYGELGNGTNISTTSPVAIPGMSNVKFYTTGYLTSVIKYDNTIWVWPFDNRLPGQVMLSDVKFVDAGASHLAFVKNDGSVWGAGPNAAGELGNGTTIQTALNTPVQMLGITNAVRAIAVGAALVGLQPATIILLADSTVKITGGGGWFQNVNSTVPVILSGLTKVVDIKGNAVAAYALKSDGTVYSFGKDILSVPIPALGLGLTSGDVITPTKINFPADAAPIIAISSNNDGYSALALDSNRNVYSWGYNAHGQLGDGTIEARSTPTLVATNIIDIYAGETFSYILKADSTLWATGETGYEQDPPGTWGSIWMNLPNIQRNTFTKIDPLIEPMNLCAPKIYGTVPLQLLSFYCIAVGKANNLIWASADEINFTEYIIEYSTDGVNFQSIATIYAKGPNSQYNYLHQKVTGTAFYRLKMIDNDGGYKYSEIRIAASQSNSNFITIFPNPASNVASIVIKKNTDVVSVQVVSIEGKIIKTISNYTSGQEININNFSKGTYILKIISKDNKIEFARLIKI